MAEVDSFADNIFFAVSLVPVARGNFTDQRPGDSAEPIQYRRPGRDAFRAISLDYELLCPPRSRGGSVEQAAAQLAPAGLFRRAGRRWHRLVRAGAVGGEPCLSS